MRLIEAATVQPVTLAQAKVHLHVDGSEEDDLITAMIEAAVGHMDGWSGVLGRALEAQTWEESFDSFPDVICLRLGPVVSISSIIWTDQDGAEQTLAPEDYTVETGSFGARIEPAGSWPDASAVRVQWVAGEGCPARIRQAILMTIGHWHANREAVAVGSIATEIPLGAHALIGAWRRTTL